MTCFELKKYISEKLAAASGELSDYETSLFMEKLCGCSRAELLMHMHEEAHFDAELLENMISRRTKGEPAEYILGETVFFDMRIRLSPDCLIPRADTEFVCEKALSLMPENARVADLCTGSGCIAIALAGHGHARVKAYDISAGAIKQAKENAIRNDVSERVSFFVADVKNDILEGEYDIIISNPPYIKTAEIAGLGAGISYEPYAALDGGSDGMDFYRAILSYAPKHLKKGGKIVFEIGYDEENDIKKLAAEHGLCHDVFRDYGGNPRAAVIYRKGE